MTLPLDLAELVVDVVGVPCQQRNLPISWDNVSGTRKRANAARSLTHHSPTRDGGLAMDATRQACSIHSCDRPAKGRGWCATHWARWRKHGDPNYVRPQLPRRTCTLEGCDKPRHSAIHCAMHHARFRRGGDPNIVGDHYPGRPRVQTPGYAAVHKRLLRDIAPATSFDCIECGANAEEWSYNGGAREELFETVNGALLAYSTDLGDYSPRCRPCHRRLDDSLVRERDDLGRWAAS